MIKGCLGDVFDVVIIRDGSGSGGDARDYGGGGEMETWSHQWKG